METREKIFNILTIGPLIAAPLLAVEFPRVLAYLPIISAIFGGLILYFGFNQKPKIPKSVIISLCAVVGLAALSVLWATFPDESAERAGKLAPLFIGYALFFGVIIAGKEYVSKNAILYFLVSCALGATLCVVDLSLDSQIHKWIRDITPEEAFSTAVFNRGAVTIIFLSLAVFMIDAKKWQKQKIFFYVPILFMIALIQSQSGQLAALLGVLCYSCFPSKQSWAWCGAFIVIAAWMIAKPFIITPLHAIIPQSVDDYEIIRETYIWGRFEIWEFVSDQILAHPWLGQGIEVTRNIKHAFSNDTDSILHPHSAVLQIWIEFGAIGIALSIAAIGWLMKYMYQSLDPQTRRAAFTSFIVLFAVADVSYGLWQAWWLGLFALLAGVYIIAAPKKAVV